jgi:hypothetical protein
MNSKKKDNRCPDLIYGDDGLLYSISSCGRDLTICYQIPNEAEVKESSDRGETDVAKKDKNGRILRGGDALLF